MNAERAQAYGRVVRAVEDLGPAKLLPAEEERIRAAADTLVLCGEPDCFADVREALADIEDLAAHLVDSDRWTEETAAQLVRDVEACGPLAPVGC
jgi:hypothetical protein